MKSAIVKLSIAVAISAATFLSSSTASAERPTNIRETTWTVRTNRGTEQLFIISQGDSEAPGAENCRHINGELGTPPPTIKIQGWYCPSTGRIHFVHKNLATDNAVRVFTGYVSDVSEDELDQSLYMAGTMTVLAIAFGDLGEYNFSAIHNP